MEQLYDELMPVAQGIQEEERERRRLQLDRPRYRMFDFLKTRTGADEPEAIVHVNELIQEISDLTFPGWWEKKDVVKEVEQTILLFLIPRVEGKGDPQKTRDELVKLLKAVRWTSSEEK